MNYQSFLVRNQWLTRDDYLKLEWAAIRSMDGRTDPSLVITPALRDVSTENLHTIRPHPFGDVLQSDRKILEKVLIASKAASFEQTVQWWQSWHVENIQPLSDYYLGPPKEESFGRKLWEREAEKRLCGNWIARELVKDSDHIVIPEGTSTFWVALAALQARSKLVVITSNGGLIRELSENPELRAKTRSVTVVGGELDVAVGGIGRGFVGGPAQQAYDVAFHEPGATVLVCSVNGLLPETGPYGPCHVSAKTRYDLLDTAIKKKVNRIVFVTDYSKMRSGAEFEKHYGEPMFVEKEEWSRFLKQYLNRISIVAAPPPELRKNSTVMALRPRARAIQGFGYSPPIIDYLKVAAQFDKMCETSDGQQQFIEVGGMPAAVPVG